VHNELAGLDPPPDRPGRNAETIGDLGDREKFDLIVAVTAATGMAAVDDLRNGLSGHRGPHYAEVS